MPGLTEPAAATRMTDREDGAAFQPGDARRAKRRVQDDAVGSVAFEIGRVRAVALDASLINDGKRYHGTV